MNLKNKTVVLGVTSSIAAYKACDLVSLLKKEGANIHVIMTKNACELIRPRTFETLTGNKVTIESFEKNIDFEVEHISLAKRADIFVVAPATANFVAKFANGIADDFLSTSALAFTCPIVIAPAMNSAMLNHPATQKNIQTLKERGVKIIATQKGMLACGDIGEGKLAKVNYITQEIIEILTEKKDYLGKTIMILSGATIAKIDPVRYLTNNSSGKMGLALAKKAKQRGANIVLIEGKTSVDSNEFAPIKVETTIEMHDIALKNLKNVDMIICPSAPCDYFLTPEKNKIKNEKIILKLEKTVDIAKEISSKKGKKKLIIFAAETENLIENAKSKLEKKGADMVVANDVSFPESVFNSDFNIASILTKTEQIDLVKMTKMELADRILTEIQKLK
ncbi:MAG: bifunctional phosphopantothenoylcysteine decarboxylase/phosphopantothenate--cysteine ligase CoaBC [Firmicutes bacterium]|nr:bifunctional phosphopantothenoylcysteine decarboxylase/phosphopantothenate--cysteine ligase CoaBC [Bacillota bacterium]MCL2256158.1 bifunctional phosphopantothenoylcysteine decarboxylase/phosphopantothenate--cysteine ligase CoaBC [Bacillota bacterium]